MSKNNNNWTHERLVPDELAIYNKQMYFDHIDRYKFASKFILGKSVLDIACGSGYGSKYLLDHGANHVVGVDISSDAIIYAKNKYEDKNISFKKKDATKTALKSKSFDIIVSFETIEHIQNYHKYLQEMFRLLKDDGIFIVSTPNKILGGENMNPYHFKEFYQQEFITILSEYFGSIDLFGQKPVFEKYIIGVNKLVKKIPNGFLKWFVDSLLKMIFRGSKVKHIDNFKHGFIPTYFVAVCKK